MTCVSGEPWGTCINRAVQGLVGGAFMPGEHSACIAFRDDSGIWWALTTTWGECGTAKQPPSTPDSCKVSSAGDWNIPFGSVDRSEISTSDGTEKTKDLTLVCTGATAHDFSVKLNMTPTSWSTSQLATSNPDLGIEVTVGGTAAKLGESFTMKVTGSGSKTLGFSVLRNPTTKAMDIATGDFTASGTLEVSED
ncbi:fimbrial protein [Serratia proteamaculans]|uniref:fimbrial protein n=1 Tax=Serratia proteamaculans TaxID=28151 RepID=UPI003CF6EFB7